MLVNFDYGSKTNWRRWQWNRIKARLEVNPSDAKILCLAGPENMDTINAMQKKFKPHNMILVSKDDATVKQLRKKGMIVINCELRRLIEAWPEQYPIDVVVADFMSGLSWNIVYLFDSMLISKGMRNGVIVSVNMLRGRDAQTNGLRKKLEDMHYAERKHRGKQLMMFFYGLRHCIFADLIEEYKRKICEIKSRYDAIKIELKLCEPLLSRDENIVLLNHLIALNKRMKELINFHYVFDPTDVTYNSYRCANKRTYMDSVVFKFPTDIDVNTGDGVELQRCKAKASSFRNTRREVILFSAAVKEAKRKISAALAVRTMRMNGQL